MDKDKIQKIKESKIWKTDFKNIEDTMDRGINDDDSIPNFVKSMNLIIRTSDLMKKYAENHFNIYDLSTAQKDILSALYFCGENYLTQTRLSTFVYTSKANISSLLDRMEKKGLILRVLNPLNKRENMISITNQGKKFFEKLLSSCNIVPLEDVLSDKESLSLKIMLTKLRDGYKELLENQKLEFKNKDGKN